MNPEAIIYSLLASQGLPIDKFMMIRNMVEAYDSPIFALHSDNFIKALRDAFPLPYNDVETKQIADTKNS